MGLMAQSTDPIPVYQDGVWYSYIDDGLYYIQGVEKCVSPSATTTVGRGAIKVYDISNTFRPRQDAVEVSFCLFVSNYTNTPWFMDVILDVNEDQYLGSLQTTKVKTKINDATPNKNVAKYTSSTATSVSYQIYNTNYDTDNPVSTNANWWYASDGVTLTDNVKKIGELWPYVYRKASPTGSTTDNPEGPEIREDNDRHFKKLETQINISDNNSTIGFFKSYCSQNTNLYIANCRIAVAEHLRFEGGTYGTDDISDINFPSISSSSSDEVTIPVRSFLTGEGGMSVNLVDVNGNPITDAAILNSFKVRVRQYDGSYIEYPMNSTILGANMCGYPDADSTLAGKPIDTRDFLKVVYCPSEGLDSEVSVKVVVTSGTESEDVSININASEPTGTEDAKTLGDSDFTSAAEGSNVNNIIPISNTEIDVPAGATDVTYSIADASTITDAGEATVDESGNITVTKAGNIGVVVSYTDENGAHHEVTNILEVGKADANLEVAGSQTMTPGSSQTVTATTLAADEIAAEGKSLTYSIIDAPEGVSIDQNGNLIIASTVDPETLSSITVQVTSPETTNYKADVETLVVNIVAAPTIEDLNIQITETDGKAPNSPQGLNTDLGTITSITYEESSSAIDIAGTGDDTKVEPEALTGSTPAEVIAHITTSTGVTIDVPFDVNVIPADADITATANKYMVVGSDQTISATTGDETLDEDLKYEVITTDDAVTIDEDGVLHVETDATAGTTVNVVITLDNENYIADPETLAVTIIEAPTVAPLVLTYGDNDGEEPTVTLPDELSGATITYEIPTTGDDYISLSSDGKSIIPEDVTENPIQVIAHITKVIDGETVTVDVPFSVTVVKADPIIEWSDLNEDGNPDVPSDMFDDSEQPVGAEGTFPGLPEGETAPEVTVTINEDCETCTGKAHIEDGKIVVDEPGIVEVVAHTDGNDKYNSADKTQLITLFENPFEDMDLTYGDDNQPIQPKEGTTLPDGYSIVDCELADGVPDGKIEIVGNATDGFEVKVDGANVTEVDGENVPNDMTVNVTLSDGEGHTFVVPVNVTVKKATPDVDVDGAEVMTPGSSQTVVGTTTNPELTSEGKQITYSIDYGDLSDDIKSQISIDATTGELTIGPDVPTGTEINVIATSPETANYEEASETLTVTVAANPFDNMNLHYGDNNQSIQPKTGETLPNGYVITDCSVDDPTACSGKIEIVENTTTGGYEVKVDGANVDGEGNLVPMTVNVTLTEPNCTEDCKSIVVPVYVTVAKGTPTISWPNKTTDTDNYDATNSEFSYMESDIDVTLDAVLTFDNTDKNVNATGDEYSTDATSNVALDNTGVGSIEITGVTSTDVTVTVTFPATDNYVETTETWTFKVVPTPLTVTICENGKDEDGEPIINDPDDDDNVIELGLFAAKGETVVNTASYQAIVTTELVDLGVLSTNYNNVTYTIAAGDDDHANIAAVNGGKLDAYRLGEYPLAITATAENGATATVDLSINIPRGTMVFNTAGDWNTNSNWHRPDILPLGENHNVEILENCTVSTTNSADNATNVTGVPADCYDLTVTLGTLTIASTGALTVENTLTSDDVAKILIKAEETKAGSVWFLSGSPLATVELYGYGSKDEYNPIWQYRGIPVDASSITITGITSTSYNGYQLPGIYEWTETPEQSEQGDYKENWHRIHDGSLSAWTGYSFAKMTDESASGYVAIAKGTLLTGNHQYDLVKTGISTNYNDGNNLITNSYAAPIDLGALQEEDFQNANATVTFFNHDSDESYRRQYSGGPATGDGAGQLTVWPIFSGAAANNATGKTIASGESFLVQATAGQNASFTVRHEVLKSNSTNGQLHAPRKAEEFNILEMYVEGGENGDRLVLMENENCSGRYDNGYDGLKMQSTGKAPQLYATNDFGKTAINVDEKIIGQYVGFKAAKNGIKYTVSFNTDRLEGYEWLYLFDTKENKYTNILEGETYTFTGTYSGEEKRFIIVGEREDGTKSTGNDQKIEVVNGQVLVTGFDGMSESLMIFDMSGKMVWQSNTIFGPWFDLPGAIPDGVYVIKAGNCQTKFLK